MAKEGLFNILNNRVAFSDLNVLDLFAGTGNISLEFQSRGVTKTTSIDSNYQCTAFIKKTLAELGCPNSVVIKSDVLRFIQSSNQKWDLIFADPPYDFEFYQPLVDSILDKELLSLEGTFVLEHPSTVSFNDTKHYTETRKYGRVHFSFFELKP